MLRADSTLPNKCTVLPSTCTVIDAASSPGAVISACCTRIASACSVETPGGEVVLASTDAAPWALDEHATTNGNATATSHRDITHLDLAHRHRRALTIGPLLRLR